MRPGCNTKVNNLVFETPKNRRKPDKGGKRQGQQCIFETGKDTFDSRETGVIVSEGTRGTVLWSLEEELEVLVETDHDGTRRRNFDKTGNETC